MDSSRFILIYSTWKLLRWKRFQWLHSISRSLQQSLSYNNTTLLYRLLLMYMAGDSISLFAIHRFMDFAAESDAKDETALIEARDFECERAKAEAKQCSLPFISYVIRTRRCICT